MKRAIVTGGAGLIGTAIARALLERGWEVACLDLLPAPLGIPVTCDLSEESSVARAIEGLDWDRVDLVVNNGGRTSGLGLAITEATLDDWQGMIASHLTGAFLVSRAAAPLMQAGSCIVNMTSTRALMSEGGDFAYAAAKGGLVALTQALAVQLGPDIRVNAIAPGWITDAAELSMTDHAQHPAGRVGRPEDIADAVLYLAEAGFVTGQTLIVDGGMTKKMIYAE
ncbi:SDR family NAD(P)-dependent oxidoreductase [Mangrovicoccus algicola]|uniref:SDR family oxidoreductase n=1 Tax=Mangrovicoccus algicola TaxID=2771008 RepID=A0A8J6YTG0_9RHOB|nr:SDR family oxidoreductase [Mangrovicoccus algicola]MBE3638913.1 SDR family oxidoreductase [Mangrovicoccus algicola]